jgi:hypothetical protein
MDASGLVRFSGDAPVPEVLSDIPASPPSFRRVEPTPPTR